MHTCKHKSISTSLQPNNEKTCYTTNIYFQHNLLPCQSI